MNRQRIHPQLRLFGFVISMLTILLMACGPSAAPSGGAAADKGAPAKQKQLVMAMQGEPSSVVLYGRPSASSTPNYERYFAYHANLTMFDLQNSPVAHIAAKVPSIDAGDWKINPDGTMEVTWSIRPDAVWHDGTPLTAEDYVFGYQLVSTKELAVASLGEVLKISGVKAVDPQTLVFSWKEPSFWANTNGTEGVPALPKHLLQKPYDEMKSSGDISAVDSSPLWTGSWVGLGPFKMTEWVQGSHIDSVAFDQYVYGRPKIDRLIMRWIADVNVIMANVMADVVDVAPMGSMLKPEQAAELQRTWQAQGKGEAYTSPNAMRTLYLQHRDPNAPWVKDVKFRQAMIMSMDRQAYVEALQYGLTTIGNYYVMLSHPAIKLAEDRKVVKYAYDPAKAQQLFAEAGWTKGVDGLLRNSAGDTIPFFCCRQVDDDSNDIRESLTVDADLQRAGIQATHPIRPAPAGLSTTETRKWTAQPDNKSGNVSPVRFGQRESFNLFTSDMIATEANRWQGSNSGGWSNKPFDELNTLSNRTFKASERLETEFQMVKLIAEELPILPMYYNPLSVAVAKRVTGIVQGANHAPLLSLGTSWNIHTWDVK